MSDRAPIIDEADVRGGWLLLGRSCDLRIQVNLSRIISWSYDVGQGIVRIETPTGAISARGSGDDRFDITNELDQLLWRALIEP